MKHLSILAMTALTLAACSSNDEPLVNKGNSETFRLTAQMSSQASRSNNTSLQGTKVAEGAKLGVYVNDNQTPFYSNVEVTADALGNLAAAEDFKWGSHETASVISYHPYNANWTLGENTFTVATDQSADADYLASDLLYGTATGTNGADEIGVSYVHKLAKVVVTVLSDDANVDFTGATITLSGVKTSTTIDLTNGNLGTATGDATSVSAGTVKSNTENSCAAIIVPQTVEAATKFVEVRTTDGQYLTYTLTADKEFEANKEYTYTLTLYNSTLALVSSTIGAWTQEANTGTLEYGQEPGKTYAITWTSYDWAGDAPTAGGTFYAGGLVYVDDLTFNATQGANADRIKAQLGVSATGDINGTDWTWADAAYNFQSGDNYYYQGGVTIAADGTYYYTMRFKLDEGEWVYTYDNNTFKTITVGNSTPSTPTYTITWTAYNNEAGQWDDNGTPKLALGCYVFCEGITCDANGSLAGNGDQIKAQIGLSTDASADFNDWTWTDAGFDHVDGNNYVYYGNTGAVTVGQTYYYTMRFKVGDEGEWVYTYDDNNAFKSIEIQ